MYDMVDNWIVIAVVAILVGTGFGAGWWLRKIIKK